MESKPENLIDEKELAHKLRLAKQSVFSIQHRLEKSKALRELSQIPRRTGIDQLINLLLGRETLQSEELVNQVQINRIKRLVNHTRKLILNCGTEFDNDDENTFIISKSGEIIPEFFLEIEDIRALTTAKEYTNGEGYLMGHKLFIYSTNKKLGAHVSFSFDYEDNFGIDITFTNKETDQFEMQYEKVLKNLNTMTLEDFLIIDYVVSKLGLVGKKLPSLRSIGE